MSKCGSLKVDQKVLVQSVHRERCSLALTTYGQLLNSISWAELVLSSVAIRDSLELGVSCCAIDLGLVILPTSRCMIYWLIRGVVAKNSTVYAPH